MSLPIICPKCNDVADWQKEPGSEKNRIDKMTIGPFYSPVKITRTTVYCCSNCGYRMENHERNY